MRTTSSNPASEPYLTSFVTEDLHYVFDSCVLYLWETLAKAEFCWIMCVTCWRSWWSTAGHWQKEQLRPSEDTTWWRSASHLETEPTTCSLRQDHRLRTCQVWRKEKTLLCCCQLTNMSHCYWVGTTETWLTLNNPGFGLTSVSEPAHQGLESRTSHWSAAPWTSHWRPSLCRPCRKHRLQSRGCCRGRDIHIQHVNYLCGHVQKHRRRRRRFREHLNWKQNQLHPWVSWNLKPLKCHENQRPLSSWLTAEHSAL